MALVVGGSNKILTSVKFNPQAERLASKEAAISQSALEQHLVHRGLDRISTTTAATPVIIDMGGDVLLESGFDADSPATAQIENLGAGGVTLTSRDLTITALFGELAEVNSAGAVSVTSRNVTINHGLIVPTGVASSRINGSSVTMVATGNLLMEGATGSGFPGKDAQITSTAGAVNLNISGTATLQGGAGFSSEAEILSVGGPITITTGGDLNVLEGSPTSGANTSAARIEAQAGSTITLNIGGDANVVGGGGNGAFAAIGGATTGVTDTINMTVTGDLNVTGGTAVTTHAFIHTASAGTGPTINVGGTIIMTGGGSATTNSALARISGGNNVIMTAGGDLIMVTPAFNHAEIFSGGTPSNISIIVGQNLNLPRLKPWDSSNRAIRHTRNRCWVILSPRGSHRTHTKRTIGRKSLSTYCVINFLVLAVWYRQFLKQENLQPIGTPIQV